VHVLERRRAARLEVDRLPRAARLPVPLLALELERMVGVVDAQDEPLRGPGRAPAVSSIENGV
jgi:hypothetical protein